MNKISIYIPAYNSEKFIGECITSLLQQTLEPAEILLINDGSTDHTLQIAQTFPKVKIISHEGNRGLSAARNTGIRESQFDLVASIDSDCCAKPDFLEQMYAAMREDPNVVGVGGALFDRYHERLPDRWRKIHLKQHRDATPILNPHFLWGHSTLFKKEALFKIGLYNEKLRTNAEDVEISEKLQRAGFSIYYCPTAIVEHIKTDTVLSIANTNWRYYCYGYFYDVTFKNLWENYKRQFRFRFKEILEENFKSISLGMTLLSIWVIVYAIYKDTEYFFKNYGQKKFYD